MRLGRKALRLFDHGDEVVRLQQALRDLGYDVGEVDGQFGYLTRDAVCQFQREYHLRVDGMVGPSVLSTLYRPELRAMRDVHVVASGERLIDIARIYGVSEDYLRRSNRLTQRNGVYEGRRLILRNRYVIGAAPSVTTARETEFALRRVGRHLTGLGGVQFQVTDQGELEGEWSAEAVAACQEQGVEALAIVNAWTDTGAPRLSVGKLLRNRKVQAAFIKRCRELAGWPGAGGLVLDLPGLRLGDGSRFTRLVCQLGALLRSKQKRFYVGVPLPAPGVHGTLHVADIDWTRLTSAVDGVIVQTHRLTPWAGSVVSPEQLRGRVKALISVVPHWKVVLGVHLGALELSEATGRVEERTYQSAMAVAFSRGKKPVWDERLSVLTSSYSTPEPNSEVRTLWIQNARAVMARLQIVERYNLHGALLWPVGGEDARVWSGFPHWIKAWRHDATERGI